jgi:type IV pilus assembly protein PilV
MEQIVLLNKNNPPPPPFTKGGLGGIRGFTLVEVMIALVITLLVFLALMQTALVGIDSNMINVLRDEAVNIAEMRMNEARNTPFDSLASAAPETVSRNLRNITNFQYTVTRTVTSRGTDNKQIDITIRWEWKEKTVANGNPYTHSISTILRRQ